MKIRLLNIGLLVSILLICVLVNATSAPTQPYHYPRAMAPYVGDAPPIIDGILHPEEYRRFAAITGMVSFGLQTVVPKIQQVVWYLGYDDKYLYLAMHSPNPPGIWPLAKAKKNDSGNDILWDDHVEIQIAKDRSTATFPGHGFYKIMANGKNAINDDWFYNGTPGTESNWSFGGQLKSSVTKESWDLEIACDLRAFDVKKLEGATWVIQLLRADAPGGVYFAGWVGRSWMEWDQFGEVTFDHTAPVLRFLETGDLTKGDMKLGFELVGQTDREIPVTLNVIIKDGNGKIVFDQIQKETAVKNIVKTINVADTISYTLEGNHLEILATYPQVDADGQQREQVLYHWQGPIIQLSQAYFDRHIAPWLAQRPKGDFDWSFAYWPSYGVAKTSLDVDFFGIDDTLAKASVFRVNVKKKNKNKALASATGEIKNKQGQMVMKELKLPVGDYAAEVEVISADGKSVVGSRKMDFVRRNYEWEGKTLGTTDRVIPPFIPIQIKGTDCEVWGRKYTLGDDGLLSKIVASGGAGPENLLTAPMQLVAIEKGKQVQVSNAKSIINEQSPARVSLTTSGQLGSADCKVESCLEYDGWYNVKLTLSPTAAATTTAFSELALNIPLWGAADTMYVQRAGDVRSGNRFGAIPAGNGLVWKSSELLPLGNWGSFCPIVFIGNGDKGLWWFAEENRGWTLSDKKAAIEVYRRDSGLDLRINLFAAPTVLHTPRTIEFAFLIDPVKQMPDERKWAWGKLHYSHNTFGYRYWGGSVDGFENSDTDLEALKAVITDPSWSIDNDKEIPPNLRNHINYFRNQHYEEVGKRNEKLVLYGSGAMTGMGMSEFDTYGGEWLGRTNWIPNPDTTFTNWRNMQNTMTWKTPRQLSATGVNFNRSFEDCFIWHHYRLLAKTPVNGTWWDNSSIFEVEDYDPVKGEFYRRFNVFARRRLMKRLATIGWELNRPPWWINNMHVDWSFCQVSWHIENDFYIDNADSTMMDQLSVDEFRAMCRIKRGIIHRLASATQPGTSEQMRKTGRSIVGMCLLHDIGSYYRGADADCAPGMLKVLDEKVDFFDSAEFIGYWRNNLFKVETPKVYVSLYRGSGRVLAVVLNEKRTNQDVPFKLDPNLLPGRTVQRIYDAETSQEFRPIYDYDKKQYILGDFKSGVFGIPASGVRLLVVE